MLRRRFLAALGVSFAIPSIGLAHSSPDTVTLQLTPAEAQALANICSSVGGHTILSDRGHIDTIREMLHENGYAFQWGNVLKSSITMRNYSDYRDARPSGPNHTFQHEPRFRYLRRQHDGVVC